MEIDPFPSDIFNQNIAEFPTYSHADCDLRISSQDQSEVSSQIGIGGEVTNQIPPEDIVIEADVLNDRSGQLSMFSELCPLRDGWFILLLR